MFSRIDDPTKWNAQCPSKSLIDRIITTNAQNRKAVQVAKMQNTRATALKIDFSYKYPKKIKVHTAQGELFAPFQCSANVHQENGLCVFFKAYHSAEGFGDNCMGPDLVLLKKRYDILNCKIRAIWCDNCCSSRNKLQSIFPDACVLLDGWHWLERWSQAVFDRKSPEAQIFFQLIRGAMYMIEDTEYQRAKEAFMNRTGREPTKSQLMKEAKSIIPPPAELKKRLDAVLRYVLHSDSLLDLDEANLAVTPVDSVDGQMATRKRFLSRNVELVTKVIRNQMVHVVKGCLSDPPSSVLPMHQVNPYTKQAFAARSTGTNEVDNRALNHLFDAPSIGIARGERILFDHYERANESRATKRLGAPVPVSSKSERLYFLNSVAKSAGIEEKDLPVKVSHPPDIGLKEFMGFDYDLPATLKEGGVVSTEDTPADSGQEGLNDFQDFLQDLGYEDEDVPVIATETSTVEEVAAVEAAANAILQDPTIDLSPLDNNRLETEMAKHLPFIKHKETSMESFTRLTRGSPWVDFRHPKDRTKFDPVDKAEYALFDKLRPHYDRFGRNLNGPKGYQTFSQAWDSEVVKSYSARMDAISCGEDPPPLIRRKTYRQLQQHFDRVVAFERQAAVATQDKDARREMEQTLRDTRRSLPDHQEAVMAGGALEYHHGQFGGTPAFGNPAPLNNAITAATVDGVRDAGAPFVVRGVPANPTLAEMPMLNPRGTNFKNKAFCVKCGFSKSEHIATSTVFGNMCSGNCHHEECSKCLQRLEFHSIGKVGPYCPNPPHPRSQYHNWYKEKPDSNSDNSNNNENEDNQNNGGVVGANII